MQFLSSFGAKLDSTEESKDDSSGGNDAFHDFVAPHNFKGDFSYGGATISVEEILVCSISQEFPLIKSCRLMPMITLS